MGARDLRSESVTATGTVHGTRCRLRGVIWTGGNSSGNLTFRDGGASGSILLQLAVNTNNQDSSLEVVSDGILFKTDLHCTIDSGVATKVNCLVEG